MSLHIAVLFCWWIVKLLGNGVHRVVSSHILEIKDKSLLPILQCTVEPDPQNLASALLEGAWEVDESWSLQLAKELEPEAEATQTLSFYRNDSIADILPAEVCQYYPQRIYMAGELSWERKDGSSNGKNTAFLISTSPEILLLYLLVWPFILLTKSGNPHLVFYDLEQVKL